MNENDLLKAVLRYASQSIKPPLNSDGSVVMCLQYSNADLEQYLNGRITGQDKEAFEQHASHCDICLYGLVQMQETMENKKLTNHALEFMNTYKPRPYFANTIQIAAQWEGKLAWLVGLPGEEMIQQDLAVATRSKKRASDSKTSTKKQVKPKKILRQLEQFGISIEAEVGTANNGSNFTLQLSFYDLKQEEFIKELEVELTGAEPIEPIHTKTDENGCVDFVIQKAGDYDIFVMRKQEALLHFSLDLTILD
jgi:hypothetical protein